MNPTYQTQTATILPQLLDFVVFWVEGGQNCQFGDAGWAVVIMTGEEERNLQPES